MSGLIKTRVSLSLGLLALVAFATPALGQDDCRGWARSCASVDVRVEGDRLIFFTPNIVVEPAESAETEDGSERVTLLPAGVSDDPYATMTVASGVGASGAVAPPDRRCEEEQDDEEDDEDDCGPPVGALVLLALPASLFILSPGDSDDATVQAPLNEPVSGPGNPPAGDGVGGDGDAGGGETGGNDGGDSGDAGGDTAGADSGGAADDGSNSGNNNNSGNTGGNSGATGGNSGTSGGNSGSNPGSGSASGDGGSGDDGSGDDWGPYHPEAAPPGAADLPPISQVPEPISTTLFGIGLAGYAAARRRRRSTELVEDQEG